MDKAFVFQLKAETAVFCHGAKNKAEIREAEFRGLARYWFRCALGPVLPVEPSIKHEKACGCLRCVEERIFGSTHAGAKVIFRVRQEKARTVVRSLLPHLKNEGSVEKKDPSSSHKREDAPSSAFEDGSEFTLKVMRYCPAGSAEDLDVVGARVWLSLLLGGIGQRSRRGAGTFRVLRSEKPCGSKFMGETFDGADFEGFCKYLKKQVAYVISFLRTAVSSTLHLGSTVGSGWFKAQQEDSPPFPMLIDDMDLTRIQVVRLKAGDEEEARAEVMRGLRPYKNPVFGLPYLKPAPGERPVKGRHASPLWIRLFRLEGDKCWAMVQTAMRSATLTGDWSRLDKYLAQSLSNGGNVIWP